MNALGCFRGEILDGGVSKSPGGWPQLVLKVTADEMYDEGAREWLPWEDFEWSAAEVNNRTIVTYLVLFGKDGATLNCDQVRKITGWGENESFTVLAARNLTGVKIQWRNEEDTWEGNTKVKVVWVDVYDAVPGGSIRKLDAKDLSALDAKFSKFLKAENKPQSAGGGRGKTKPEANAGTTEEKPKRGGRGRSKKKDEVPAATNPDTPPTSSEPPVGDGGPPEAPAGEADIFKNNGPCTKQEAWADVTSKRPEVVSLEQLGAIWLKQIAITAPGKDQSELTEDDWSAVRAAVMDVAQIPF